MVALETTQISCSPCSKNSIMAYTGSVRVQTPKRATILGCLNRFIMPTSLKKSSCKKKQRRITLHYNIQKKLLFVNMYSYKNNLWHLLVQQGEEESQHCRLTFSSMEWRILRVLTATATQWSPSSISPPHTVPKAPSPSLRLRTTFLRGISHSSRVRQCEYSDDRSPNSFIRWCVAFTLASYLQQWR